MTDDIALELYPPEYCLSDVIQQQSIRANPTLEPTVLLSFVFISWALTYDKYPRRWTCVHNLLRNLVKSQNASYLSVPDLTQPFTKR